jgi:hypothetical protein
MSIFQSITSNDITVTPFQAHKLYNITDANTYGVNILLGNFEYGKYNIADLNDPNVQQLTISHGYYDYLIWNSIYHNYYENFYTSTYNVFDVPYAQEKRNINSSIIILTVPQSIYGEQLTKNTVTIYNDSCSISDDGAGNLIDANISQSMSSFYSTFTDNTVGHWLMNDLYLTNKSRDDSTHNTYMNHYNVGSHVSDYNDRIIVPLYNDSYSRIYHDSQYELYNDFTVMCQLNPNPTQDNNVSTIISKNGVKQNTITSADEFIIQPYPLKLEYSSSGNFFSIIYSRYDGYQTQYLSSSLLPTSSLVYSYISKTANNYELGVYIADNTGSYSSEIVSASFDTQKIYNQCDIVIGKNGSDISNTQNTSYFVGSIYDVRLLDIGQPISLSDYWDNVLYQSFDYYVGNVFYQTGIITIASAHPKFLSLVPTGGVLSGGTTVCALSNSTTLSLTNYNIAEPFVWQYSLNSVDWYDIVNTADTYNITNLTITTSYRIYFPNGNIMSLYSNVTTIYVSPISVGGSISGGGTVCTGVNSTLLTLTGYTGTIIKWQYSENNIDWVDIANTNNTYTATNLTVDTYYRVEVKSGVCIATYSIISTITINPLSVGGTLTGDATVCAGVNSTVLSLHGYTGTIIKWQYSLDGINWSGIYNLTDTYTVTNISNSTYYRVEVQSGACPSAFSSNSLITVNPLSVGGSISGGSAVCNGVNSTLLTLTGYTGTINKWEYSLDQMTWFDITNTTDTYTATNLTVDTYYRAEVQSGICFAVRSSIKLITVNPLSVGGTAVPDKTEISDGEAVDITLSGEIGLIQWEQSADDITYIDVIGGHNPTSNIYSTDLLYASTYFRARVTSGNCPPAYSNRVFITVTY